MSWSGGSTRAWRKLRAAKLEASPLCERPGPPHLATEVHHDPPFTTEDERFDYDRLVSLCHDHHANETAKQSRAARTFGPKGKGRLDH